MRSEDNSSPPSDHTEHSSTHSSTYSSTHSSTQLLEMIFKKCDAIEDFLIRLNVKIDALRDMPLPASGALRSALGSVDVNSLKELGLPSGSKLDLDRLEENLKNDLEFKGRLVSHS